MLHAHFCYIVSRIFASFDAWVLKPECSFDLNELQHNIKTLRGSKAISRNRHYVWAHREAECYFGKHPWDCGEVWICWFTFFFPNVHIDCITVQNR